MANSNEYEVNEAKLARALFDLAEDYKTDAEIMGYVSYLCFRINELLKTTSQKGESKIDWQEMGNYFDMLEFGMQEYVKKHSYKTDAERAVEKIL